MVRLFKASRRKGQWNRMLGYSQVVRRSSPAFCCATSGLLLCLAVIGYRLSVQRTLPADVLESGFHEGYSSEYSTGRHLLQTAAKENVSITLHYNYKCQVVNASTKINVAWETCDFEKSTNSIAGWVVLYLFVTVITFIAMAIVCDDFFVPSLEVISEKLHLSDDVAGATFMAAGSSAPELFNSLAAVAFDSDAGIGTVAGSAVFNLLVIVALSAAFAGKVLSLDWRPLLRDSMWYLVSILYFIFVMHDTVVQIWDALGMLVLYTLYIAIMAFNVPLMDGLSDAADRCKCTSRSEETEKIAADPTDKATSDTNAARTPAQSERKEFRHDKSNSVMVSLLDSKVRVRSYSKMSQDSSIKEMEEIVEPEAEDEARIACCACCACCPDIRGAPPSREPHMSCSQWLVFVLKWAVFVVAFPFLCLFSWTIPECSRENLKKYFPLSFIVSLSWIAAISFCMVTAVARLGCLLGIDTFVMALVFLAAGASIPDLLTSIIVAKDGFGDMAVSNAVGSNVFDIDLGLGLPFFIRLCINGLEPLDLFSAKERRYYCQHAMKMIPHVKFGVILVILLAACMAVFAIARFQLGRFIGISFFLLYLGFLVYAFLQQFLCTYDC